MAGRDPALFEHIAETIADRTEIPDSFFVKKRTQKANYTFHSDGVDWMVSTAAESSAISISGKGPYLGNGYNLSMTVAGTTTTLSFYVVDPVDTISLNRACAVRCIKELAETEVYMVQLLVQEPKSQPSE